MPTKGEGSVVHDNMIDSRSTSPRQEDTLIAFEQAQHAFRRSRRLHHIAFCSLFGLALAFSCYVGEVNVENLVEGLPSLLNYIRDIMPHIRAHRVLQDVGEWYWGIGKWLTLLFDTVSMAFLGSFWVLAGRF